MIICLQLKRNIPYPYSDKVQIINNFRFGNIVFDSEISTTVTRTVSVRKSYIVVNFQDIIDTQFTGGNIPEKYEQIKLHLNLGYGSSAPCGGFINFFQITDENGKEVIIYSGINEVNNSHYIVTVHKILLD